MQPSFKHYAILIAILLSCLNIKAQNNNSGTLKVRKNEPLIAYASIAEHSNDTVNITQIIESPFVELNSNKSGNIVSFEIGFTFDGDYHGIRSKTNKIPKKALDYLKTGRVAIIFIERILADIEGIEKQVRLPSFTLNLRN